MSEHVGSGRASKKRRLHPFRRIARFFLRSQKQPAKQQVDQQRVCGGPTIFHNLLPFLEPLITLDPKLRSIEDRIIGRSQPTPRANVVQLPSSLEDLQACVKEAAGPCDCDECTPKSYRLETEQSHGRIRHIEDEMKIKSTACSHVSSRRTTPRPALSLKLYGDYEAMRLVRHHVTWLDYIYLHPSRSKDISSVSQLTSLLFTWKANLVAQDLRAAVSAAQLTQLFRQLNDVFFFGAVPPHRQSLSTGFSWLPESRKDCFGVSSFNPIIGTQLFLHPKLYRHNSKPEDLDVRLRNRIGTILHEMCHAYLKAYTCRSCVMHDQSVGPRGHGRAWQLLAAKVEEVASSLMGGPVDMGRYPSLLHDMEIHGRLPSQHDLEVYRFGRDTASSR